jgi:hypothetical protein
MYRAGAFGRPLPESATGHQFESRREGSKLATIIYMSVEAWQKWARCSRHDDRCEAKPRPAAAGEKLRQVHPGQALSCRTVQPLESPRDGVKVLQACWTKCWP